MTANRERALQVVHGLAAGTLDRSLFTDDATWWAVTGDTFPLDAFLGLLAMLHDRTIGGIVVDTGLVMADGDHVVIQGTSDVPLVNGGRYANRYLFLVEFRDGLVHQVREYNDHAHVLAAFELS